MAFDAQTYDRIEEAEKNILDGIGKKLDPPINDIETAIDNFEKIASSLPSGVPAPSLASISSSSNEEGIDVTLTANVKSYEQSNESFVLSRTDGVMVRYKEDSFPVNKEDGTLAFIDTDLFTVGSNGEITPKQKTNRVVGLTNGKTYCFTAFPYSTQNVYNESAGSKNCTKCQWTGTKGTLTVNVTQDFDYKTLGEFTVTMTPTSGGQAISKTSSGQSSVVFSNLESGQYTLSFSDADEFIKPESRSVDVIAGQSSSISCEFKYDVGDLNNVPWEIIADISESGKASDYWSIGDEKDIVVNGETLTMQIYDFDHDDLVSGGKAGITFGMKNLMRDTQKMNDSATNSGGYANTKMKNYLETTVYNGIPDELKNVIKSVVKKYYTRGNFTSSYISKINSKVFLLCVNETGKTDEGIIGIDEGYQYPIFTDLKSKGKKLNNGSGEDYTYWTRTPGGASSNNFSVIMSPGGISTQYAANSSYGVCFCFCV